MKKLNKKGFTLIELLAVIVVLSIILVITVPMILNTLGSTRQDALQASANSAAKFYEEQLGFVSIGKEESGFFGSELKKDAKGNLCPSGVSVLTADDATTGKKKGECASDVAVAIAISSAQATRIGLNTTDYSIGTSTSNNCTVKWDKNGVVTVVLRPGATGKFAGTSAATSNN